jgi:mRNA-capping enzyme
MNSIIMLQLFAMLQEVGKTNFHIRQQCIEKEIIFARSEGIRTGRINRQREPFSVRQKQFFPIFETKKVCSSRF